MEDEMSSVEKALAQASVDESQPRSIAHSTSILRAINQKLKLKLLMQSPSPNRNKTNDSKSSSLSTSPSTNLMAHLNSTYFVPENALDDTDTFAIVSQDEIDKVKT